MIPNEPVDRMPLAIDAATARTASLAGRPAAMTVSTWPRMITMTTVAAPGIPTTAGALRRLYFARFAFALVWAIVMIPLAEHLDPLTVTLLVLYPLVDVAAARADARATRATGSPTLRYLNVAVSLLAAGGLAVAGASGIPAVLRVWGAWAVVAGYAIPGAVFFLLAAIRLGRAARDN